MQIWPRRGFRRAGDRHFLYEWLLISAMALAVLLALTGYGLSEPADNLFYDQFVQQHPRTAHNDIVIVAIDDASVAQIGPWPWPRSVHAALLDQLAGAAPAAVIYDVMFNQAAPGDALLAKAMASTPVYLPFLLEAANPEGLAPRPILPVLPLLTAAAGVGNNVIEPDADGIVRGISLFAGTDHQLWPQLTVPPYLGLRGQHAPLPDGKLATRGGARGAGLQHSKRILIPFNLSARNYPEVSFVNVLRGKVPAQTFRGKVVLVGATADGLRDQFATPVSGSEGIMAGVEIQANILDALLSGDTMTAATRGAVFGLSLLPVALLLIGLLVLTPRQSLLLTIALSAGAFLASILLLRAGWLWVSPVPAVLTLLLIYPLWSWRRLEFAMSYLGQELGRLASEPHLLPERRRIVASSRGDALERDIALMQQAAQRLRDLRRFIWDSLNSLPDPILVTDRAGSVLLANQPAKDYFAREGQPAPEKSSLPSLLAPLAFVRTIGAGDHGALPATLHWPDILDPGRPENLAVMELGIEVRDPHGRDQMLKYARCMNAGGELIGWIASLTDVTALHSAERQRDDMLYLLSHDMRSPQSSIITLLDIERPQVDSPSTARLFDRIERYARRALSLADSFVQLAHAEMQTYTFDLLNFSDLVLDAVDEVWPQANTKKIEIHCQMKAEDHPLRAERSLLTRALVNVLNNAVKYSPPGTSIDCIVTQGSGPGAQVRCVIRDRGYGIAPEQQAHLFERFRRFRAPDQPLNDGIGLGMAFVKTVVLRHGGTIQVESAPEQGTTLTITLPAAAPLSAANAAPAR